MQLVPIEPIKDIRGKDKGCWRSETQILKLGHDEEDRQKGGGDNAGRLALSLRSLARLPRVATGAARGRHPRARRIDFSDIRGRRRRPWSWDTSRRIGGRAAVTTRGD